MQRSVLPCSASDIIAPSIRTLTLGPAHGALNVHNGSSTGCLVLIEGQQGGEGQGGGDVVHEPERAACAAHGAAAMWSAITIAAPAHHAGVMAGGGSAPRGGSGGRSGVVRIRSVLNTSMCLTYRLRVISMAIRTLD
eukprot:COSAG01_NODE_1163_length_11454_cov_3.546808_9_plen_137_part_00